VTTTTDDRELCGVSGGAGENAHLGELRTAAVEPAVKHCPTHALSIEEE
jgi:ferredoxin